MSKQTNNKLSAEARKHKAKFIKDLKRIHKNALAQGDHLTANTVSKALILLKHSIVEAGEIKVF